MNTLCLHSALFSTRQVLPTSPQEAQIPPLPPLASQEPGQSCSASSEHFARAFDCSEPQELVRLDSFDCAIFRPDDEFGKHDGQRV